MTATTTRTAGGLSARSRGYRSFWVTVWLLFLYSPVKASLGLSPAPMAVALTSLAVFAALYLAFFASTASATNDHREWTPTSRRRVVVRAWMFLPLLLALTLPVALTAGSTSLTMPVYVAVGGMFALPARVAWTLSLGLAAGCELIARVVPGWHDQSGAAAVSVLLASAAMFGIRESSRRAWESQRLRAELAERALDDERARMTRDLHDILGHSLTVITVKAELAGALIGAQPERAAAEVTDIERLAREALTDVRATISGERHVTVASELAGARRALEAAGIAAELPTATDEVVGDRRELFGWVLREGVTNVVRHSGAERCLVELSATSISVHDDGSGPPESPGNGLRGLQGRARAAGATLTTGTSDRLGGCVLRLDTDTAGDAS